MHSYGKRFILFFNELLVVRYTIYAPMDSSRGDAFSGMQNAAIAVVVQELLSLNVCNVFLWGTVWYRFFR